MAADSHSNCDLESQSRGPSTAGNVYPARPLRSISPPRSPLVTAKTPLSRDFASRLRSSLPRSFLPSTSPSQASSATVFEMSVGNGFLARQKSTASKTPSLPQSRASIQSANGTTNQDAHAAMENRTMGYPAFSSLLSSDDDAFVVRKFGSLHTRTILFVQDEITQLEERLALIDKQVAETQQEEYLCHNGSFRGDKMWHRERYDIMHHLSTLLEKYDRLVTSYSDMQKRPKALKRTVKNIEKWIDRYPQAITVRERGFLKEDRRDDLIATADRSKAPLRRILERTPLFYRLKPFHSKNGKATEYSRKYEGQGVIYYDDDLVDKAITIIILLLGLIMLLVPAWFLKGIDSHTERLALITGFIALFVGLLLLTTPTKPFETMIGTAAYGALLMVFMQIDK